MEAWWHALEGSDFNNDDAERRNLVSSESPSPPRQPATQSFTHTSNSPLHVIWCSFIDDSFVVDVRISPVGARGGNAFTLHARTN